MSNLFANKVKGWIEYIIKQIYYDLYINFLLKKKKNQNS